MRVKKKNQWVLEHFLGKGSWKAYSLHTCENIDKLWMTPRWVIHCSYPFFNLSLKYRLGMIRPLARGVFRCPLDTLILDTLISILFCIMQWDEKELDTQFTLFFLTPNSEILANWEWWNTEFMFLQSMYTHTIHSLCQIISSYKLSIIHLKSFIAKRVISILVNLRYLRFKLLKYKENNKKICNTFDHNFNNIPLYIMSNVSLERYYFVLYDGALTLKMSKMVLNAFCDKTLHLFHQFLDCSMARRQNKVVQ